MSTNAIMAVQRPLDLRQGKYATSKTYNSGTRFPVFDLPGQFTEQMLRFGIFLMDFNELLNRQFWMH
jgi:hypothetical protein